MTEKKLKRGQMSKKDIEYIAANHERMTVEDIAAELKRTPAFIRKQIAALPTISHEEDIGDWVSRLHASSFWLDVRRGLVGTEVKYFEQAWASYMDQFGSNADILATDELMIRDLIMLDIHAQRAMGDKANTLRRISEIENDIDREEKKGPDDRNDVLLGQLRSQLQSLYAAKQSLSKEHLDYQARKDTKLRDLKGSRDQRFKQIEESKKNVFELIRDLDSRHKREKEGRLTEKVRIAAEYVRQDWNEYTKYEDGTFDKPFLSPEGELEDDKVSDGQ